MVHVPPSGMQGASVAVASAASATGEAETAARRKERVERAMSFMVSVGEETQV